MLDVLVAVSTVLGRVAGPEPEMVMVRARKEERFKWTVQDIPAPPSTLLEPKETELT